MSSEENETQAAEAPAEQEWEQPTTPTVSIYQNPEHIEGILQQLYERALFTENSVELNDERQDTQGSEIRGRGSAGGNAKMPWLARMNLDVGLEGGGKEESRTSAGGTTITRGKYTQPFYLHVVRGTLNNRRLIKRPRTKTAASKLRPGDFVEFTAQFAPNQASTLLDIASPDLVEAIVRKQIHAKGMKGFVPGPPESIQKFALELAANQDTWGAIARSLMEAVKADFRTTKTREFYGRVGTEKDPLTFITMCEPAHFVVEDEDRILDGTYTVLAKVAGPVEKDEPVLRRNKLLERIHPEAVDYGIEQLNTEVQKAMTKLSELQSKPENEEDQTAEDEESQSAEAPDAEIFDFNFDSRVRGASVRVIPVAIFV